MDKTAGNIHMTLTFGKVAEEWLEDRRAKLREASVARYGHLLESYIYPYFKSLEISRITRRDIEFVCSELLEEGGENKTGLSPKTVSDMFSVIKNVLNYASINYDASIPNMTNIHIKQEHKTMRVFTVPEQLKLDRYLRFCPTPCNVGILVCMYTGIRLGEICALKWENINLSQRYITVNETAQRLQNGKQKSKIITLEIGNYCSRRKVPICDDLMEILLKNRCADNAYLMTGTGDVLDPRTLRYRFKKILEELEIPDANFQTLRNTFAIRCVEAGMNIKSLSEILGHASVKQTMDKYVHPSMEDKVRDVNLMSGLLAAR